MTLSLDVVGLLQGGVLKKGRIDRGKTHSPRTKQGPTSKRLRELREAVPQELLGWACVSVCVGLGAPAAGARSRQALGRVSLPAAPAAGCVCAPPCDGAPVRALASRGSRSRTGVPRRRVRVGACRGRCVR